MLTLTYSYSPHYFQHFFKTSIQNSAIPKVMGASVSSGAHSGLAAVWCSEEDELLPSLALDSSSLTPEGDDGWREVADSFSPAGDP